MGLDIYLIGKLETGETSYCSGYDAGESSHLSRRLCHLYCDYDNLGPESLLHRSITAMGLNPALLFRMRYHCYNDESALEWLVRDAETEAEQATIRAEFYAERAASWQPTAAVATLTAQVADWLDRHDIRAACYISRAYRPYFARPADGGRSAFEVDMQQLARLAEQAQQQGLPWLSFDMG